MVCEDGNTAKKNAESPMENEKQRANSREKKNSDSEVKIISGARPNGKSVWNFIHFLRY